MVVRNTQHYIHNPQAFLENSYMKSCNNQMLAQFIGSGISSLASISLFLCKQKGDNSVDEETSIAEVPKNEPINEEKEEDIIKNIKNMLNNSEINFDNESVEFQRDLINKYTTIKSVTPNITEEALSLRLNNYVKALKATQIERQMEAQLEKAKAEDEAAKDKDPTLKENKAEKELFATCDLKIVDEDIANASDPTTDEFYNARLNRGAGYVELYDTDGDEKVDFKEFVAYTEKLKGLKLDDVEKEILQKEFDKIAQGDGTIDAIEMASHLYAISRVTDGENNTASDITFKEWYTATGLGLEEKSTNNYNGHFKALYDALTKRVNE